MKIFAIGFNKTGTASLGRFFRANGLVLADNFYKSKGTRINLAKRMFDNKAAGTNLLEGIDGADCYSDLDLNTPRRNLQANALFPDLEQAYPDARFILNIRDKDNWIRSRENHKDGKYLKKQMGSMKTEDPDAVKAQWSEDWDRHMAEVRAYFADKPGKLIEFNIEEDEPQQLVDFFKDLTLDAKHWKKFRANRKLAAKLQAAEAATQEEDETVA